MRSRSASANPRLGRNRYIEEQINNNNAPVRHQPSQPDKLVKHSDLRFIVEDQVVYASKNVLSLVSPVFENMFEKKLKDRCNVEIALPKRKYSDVVKFFNYVHMCGELEDDNVYAILEMANRYECQDIVNKCESYMIRKLPRDIKRCFTDITNGLCCNGKCPLNYYVRAWIFNLMSLREKCLPVIIQMPYVYLRACSEYNLLPCDGKIELYEYREEYRLKGREPEYEMDDYHLKSREVDY